jgi:hypothetical protein
MDMCFTHPIVRHCSLPLQRRTSWLAITATEVPLANLLQTPKINPNFLQKKNQLLSTGYRGYKKMLYHSVAPDDDLM